MNFVYFFDLFVSKYTHSHPCFFSRCCKISFRKYQEEKNLADFIKTGEQDILDELKKEFVELGIKLENIASVTSMIGKMMDLGSYGSKK